MLAPASACWAADPSPSAKELWQAYPLQGTQGSRPVSTPSRTAARPARTARPARAATGGRGDASPVLVAAVAVAALAALAAWFVVRLRHRATASAAVLGAGSAPAAATGPGAPRLPSAAMGIRAGRRLRSREPPAQLAAPPDAAPPQRETHWTAEIAWEQTDQHARFRADAEGAVTGERTVVAVSPWHRWPPEGTTAVSALGEAVAGLERTLLDAGWTAAGEGAAWYAKRFTRTTEPSALASQDVRADAPPDAAPAIAETAAAAPPEAATEAPVEAAAAPPEAPAEAPVEDTAPPEAAAEAPVPPGEAPAEPPVEHTAPAPEAATEAHVEAPVDEAPGDEEPPADDAPPRTELRPAGEDAPRAEQDQTAAARWECHIAWRATGLRSRFVAVARPLGEESWRDVASSRAFRRKLRGGGPDRFDREQAVALRELDAVLTSRGWVVAGHDRAWYAMRYEWRSADPPPIPRDAAISTS